MTTLTLSNTGKRFNREWIFRSLNIELQTGGSLAILGANGSGKSTIARVMSGFMIPSEGKVELVVDGKKAEDNHFYHHISYVAPYLDLLEEFTLPEMINFHRQFKPILHDFKTADLIDILKMDQQTHKIISQFSSGMKQRVKLLLAILSKVPITFLDEPTVNLDTQGIQWFKDLLTRFADDRILVVCSNHQPAEYDFCKQAITVSDFKP